MKLTTPLYFFFLSQHCTVERMRVCPDSIRKSINPHRLSPNETCSRIEYLRFISVLLCVYMYAMVLITFSCKAHRMFAHFCILCPSNSHTAYASRVRLFLNTVPLTCDSDREECKEACQFCSCGSGRSPTVRSTNITASHRQATKANYKRSKCISRT